MVNTIQKTEETETREKILAAANRVFARKGIAAARTMEIANEANVNKALIHYYFGTKDELARTVLLGIHARVFPAVFSLLRNSQLSIAEKVRQVVAFQLDTYREYPFMPGLVAAEMFANPGILSDRLATAGPAMLSELQTQLDSAAACGEIRRIDALQFVTLLLGITAFPFIIKPMLERLFADASGGFEDFIEKRRTAAVDFLLAGLRP